MYHWCRWGFRFVENRYTENYRNIVSHQSQTSWRPQGFVAQIQIGSELPIICGFGFAGLISNCQCFTCFRLLDFRHHTVFTVMNEASVTIIDTTWRRSRSSYNMSCWIFLFLSIFSRSTVWQNYRTEHPRVEKVFHFLFIYFFFFHHYYYFVFGILLPLQRAMDTHIPSVQYIRYIMLAVNDHTHRYL